MRAGDRPKRSLFIVSLPRSLSTRIYQVCRDALGLTGPEWADDGEILNHDLLAMSRWPKLMTSARKYLTETGAPERMAALRRYLDDVTQSEGRIYKDVVQPFLVTSWSGLSEFAVLKIHRDPVEVAHAMLSHGWHYPKDALAGTDQQSRLLGARMANHYVWSVVGQRAMRARTHGRLTARLCTDAVLKGLLLAERELERLPGVRVDYRDLVRNEKALRIALEALYPELALADLRYVDAEFAAERERVSRSLPSARRKALAARIERIRATL